MRMRRLGPIALALLVIAGVAAISSRKAPRPAPPEAYLTAADRYGEYARAYESASKSESRISMSSCYGAEWDQYSNQVYRDLSSRMGDKDYLQQKAAHYDGLKQKFQKAASHPDPSLSPDPPISK